MVWSWCVTTHKNMSVLVSIYATVKNVVVIKMLAPLYCHKINHRGKTLDHIISLTEGFVDADGST